jgi:hypothetical protein
VAAAIGSESRRDLAGAFPALGYPGNEPVRWLAQERFRFYRALRGLLELLARRRPIVLALDDVQWADPASIEAIAYLLRRPAAGPLLLALAARPGQSPSQLGTAGASRGEASDRRRDRAPRRAALALGAERAVPLERVLANLDVQHVRSDGQTRNAGDQL